MNTEFGYIEVHDIHGVRGNIERREFTWKGPAKADIDLLFLDHIKAMPSGRAPRIGDVLKIGPYRLKIYDEKEWIPRYLCIRMDYPFWRLFVGWHHTMGWLDITYQRLIMTLAIWGLADYDPAVTLSWHSIKLVKWLKGRKP